MAMRPSLAYAGHPPAPDILDPERDTFPKLVRLNAERLPRKVAIVGDNRPEVYWAVTATQGLGGVPVPIYQDSVEREMPYVLDHAEIRFAVVEDQEQVDKLLHVRRQCPRLEFILYEDPRGMRSYREPFLLSLGEMEERGRAFAQAHPGHFEAETAKGTPDDDAVICYTSGTRAASSRWWPSAAPS